MNGKSDDPRVILQAGLLMASYSNHEMYAMFALARHHGWHFPMDQEEFLAQITQGISMSNAQTAELATTLGWARKRLSERELTDWFGRPGWKQRLLDLSKLLSQNAVLIRIDD